MARKAAKRPPKKRAVPRPVAAPNPALTEPLLSEPAPPAVQPPPPPQLAWSAPEFPIIKRGLLWYAAATVIFILLELAALFVLRDIFSGTVILIAGLVLMYYQALSPRTLRYTITRDEIHIGRRRYSPSEIRTFWFSTNPPRLHLEIRGRAFPISILVDTQKQPAIRQILAPLVKEDTERTEDFLAQVIKLLKL